MNRLKNKKDRKYEKRFHFHNNKQNIIKNKINNDFNKRRKNSEKFDVEKNKFKKNNNNNNKEKKKIRNSNSIILIEIQLRLNYIVKLKSK